MINRAGHADLEFPHGLPVSLRFLVEGYDLSASGAVLIIRGPGKSQNLLYSSEGKGTVTVSGNEISVTIPFEDADYGEIQDLWSVGAYSYSLTVDQNWRVQGWWKSLQDTGPVRDYPGEVSVEIAEGLVVSVAVSSPSYGGGGAGGYVLKDVDFSMLSAGEYLLWTPSADNLVADLEIRILSGFDCGLSVGTDPDHYFLANFEAEKGTGVAGRYRWRPFEKPVLPVKLFSDASPSRGDAKILILYS